MDQVKILQINY